MSQASRLTKAQMAEQIAALEAKLAAVQADVAPPAPESSSPYYSVLFEYKVDPAAPNAAYNKAFFQAKTLGKANPTARFNVAQVGDIWQIRRRIIPAAS